MEIIINMTLLDQQSLKIRELYEGKKDIRTTANIGVPRVRSWGMSFPALISFNLHLGPMRNTLLLDPLTGKERALQRSLTC